MTLTWFTKMKVLVMTGIFASIANYISTYKAGDPVYPWDIIPGMLFLLVAILLGCLVEQLALKVKIKLPNIIYISLISILMGVPQLFPFAETYVAEIDKISLLALCTPILAFAGISIGKDLDEFRKQGVGIVFVALITIGGLYLGGVVTAQLMLMATGII